MTGACSEGSYLYFLGRDYYSNTVIQKFTPAGATAGTYMSAFPGLGSTVHDIAWLGGGIWVARDNADSPVLAYNTAGLCVGSVDGVLVGGGAAGLAVDDQGYLWVSNPDNDTIYQLEVTTGIGESQGSALESRTLSVSGNPFSASTVISGEGFDDASMEVFDLSGRRVLSARFTGSYVLSGAGMPAGSYIVRVHDGQGEATSRLIRVN